MNYTRDRNSGGVISRHSPAYEARLNEIQRTKEAATQTQTTEVHSDRISALESKVAYLEDTILRIQESINV